MLEWDDKNRQLNLAKHKLDFVAVNFFFDGRPNVTSLSKYSLEVRYATTAINNSRLFGLGANIVAELYHSGGHNMGKREHIVRYTVEELREMCARGEDKSDWEQAAAMTEEEIAAAIASDPDEAGMVIDWSTTSTELPQPKKVLNMRIDADVLQFFRREGKGYQTKINAVLRSYVDQQHRQKMA